jgi:succinylarginine dihydrolase
LVTLPEGGMALVLPGEAKDNVSVWSWLEAMVAGNGPIRKLCVVDVRQSMANGGGPACLRLRVVANPETIDPRFLVDEAKLDRIARIIEAWWPERIDPDDLANAELQGRIAAARSALLSALDLGALA